MTQLQTFDDTQKLIQKYGTRDPFELIDALPNTKLWPAKSLDADGLRGFATIVNRVRYIAVNPHLPTRSSVSLPVTNWDISLNTRIICAAKPCRISTFIRPPADWKEKPISSPPIWLLDDEEVLDLIHSGNTTFSALPKSSAFQRLFLRLRCTA